MLESEALDMDGTAHLGETLEVLEHLELVFQLRCSGLALVLSMSWVYTSG